VLRLAVPRSTRVLGRAERVHAQALEVRHR
jgi:hypothetical protein